MGTFDSFADAPYAIKTEGEKITVTFKQGIPATGQGTVEWNIPGPKNGCSSGQDAAYCGIVVVVSDKPIDPRNIPNDGQRYVADPTASSDLHAGDKIGGALVVGAFYEPEKKAAGLDLTNTLVVSDIVAGQNYYVAAYAADCNARYHRDGVRAYSDKFGNPDVADAAAYQMITLGATGVGTINGSGVLPTDGTGLKAGITYLFDFLYRDDFPPAKVIPLMYRVTVNGDDAGTYADLINNINKQIALIGGPVQSSVAPNTGTYYWNAERSELYQFDGESLGDPLVYLSEPTDPTAIVDGEYWYVESTKTLYKRTSGAWVAEVFVGALNDPTAPTCDDYWFNNVDQGYSWNGTTWCEEITHAQEADPACASNMSCGSYWFDTTNEGLFAWNEELSVWETKYAIMWDNAPNTPLTNEYWFDETNQLLKQWNGALWEALGPDGTANVVIFDTEPTNPADDLYWYSAVTEELKQYDAGTLTWLDRPVLVWPLDPTDTTSCDLWWNTLNDNLYVWDVVNSQWDIVVEFIQSLTNPQEAPVITLGTLWHVPSTSLLYRWDGVAWQLVSFINWNTDPTLLATGEEWFDWTNETWFVRTATSWNAIDPVQAETDPTAVTTGAIWFDTSTNALFIHNGISWVPVAYTSSVPWPTVGERWFNTYTSAITEWQWLTRTDENNAILSDNSLWTGHWVPSAPIATVALDNTGNLRFVTAGVGSTYGFEIIAPTGSTSGAYIGHYGDYLPLNSPYIIYDTSTSKYYNTTVPLEDFLFDFLTPTALLYKDVSGWDGVDGTPTYQALGIGDDGTPDERRELMDTIRSQLGYPTVEVELTPYQLDTAVTKALENYRKRAANAYTRRFYFLDTVAGRQVYQMADKAKEYDKIVTITSIHRFTSAFLSTAHGSGVYGQIVLQHLYNMGTYDLTSYFLVSQYVEQMEHLFATRIVFHWEEAKRLLSLHQSFGRSEILLLDCSAERTEQDLLKDRLAKNWIEGWASMEARVMLAEVRGKYASLPGAGGGVSLNASDLMAHADAQRQDLLQQIDDSVADAPETWGWNTQFTIG